MDEHLSVGNAIRFSQSPRRSPQIRDGSISPIRSVHATMHTDDTHDPIDNSLKTSDFFEDTSDEEDIAMDGDRSNTTGLDSAATRYAIARLSISPQAGNLNTQPQDRTSSPLLDVESQELWPSTHPIIADEYTQLVGSSSSAFCGSFDELLSHGQKAESPEVPKPAHVPRRTTQSSAAFASSDIRPSPKRVSKAEQLFGAHAIAHEITLQALMRDEDALGHSLPTFQSMHPGERASLLPSALRAHDPRSPRTRDFPQSLHTPPPPLPPPPPPPPEPKRVQVVPPPIHTSGPRDSPKAGFAPTPYPYAHAFRKDMSIDFGGSPTPLNNLVEEGVLIVSIQRSNRNSRPRTTSIIIPVTNDLDLRPLTYGEHKRRSRALEFDDEVFFHRMRDAYIMLSGPWRFLSARHLKRIVVSGAASQAADAGYGWLLQARSPRTLVYKGLSDTFGEDKIMQNYRRPVLGKSRYAFVQWAHRLAAAPGPSPIPRDGGDALISLDRSLTRRVEQPEGLEFVVSWSARRVLAGLGSVLALTALAVLLWTFLGQNTRPASSPAGGFLDAGDRVAAGGVMGICILLIGLCCFAGWMALSWVVM